MTPLRSHARSSAFVRSVRRQSFPSRKQKLFYSSGSAAQLHYNLENEAEMWPDVNSILEAARPKGPLVELNAFSSYRPLQWVTYPSAGMYVRHGSQVCHMNENDSVRGWKGKYKSEPTYLCVGDEFCDFTVLTAENLNSLWSCQGILQGLTCIRENYSCSR